MIQEENRDRRIRKTRRAIQLALLQLMEKKDISEISVTELTDAADVNRKTFYNHYSDLYAVLSEIEDQVVEYFLGRLNTEPIQTYIDNPTLLFQDLIRELKENRHYLLLLARTEGHSRLTQKLIRKEKELLRGIMAEENLNETLVDYFLNYNAAGMSAVIRMWIQSGDDLPLESLARFFSALFTAGDIRRYIRASSAAGLPAPESDAESGKEKS